MGVALLTRAVQRVTTTLTAHNNLNEVDPVFSFDTCSWSICMDTGRGSRGVRLGSDEVDALSDDG